MTPTTYLIKRAFESRSLKVSVLLCLLLSGCQPSEVDNKPARSSGSSSGQLENPKIVAVAYPLEFLTQRIAGKSLQVRCAVPVGERASQWLPQRDDILAMQQADMIVANGVGARLAKWLDTVALPDSRICNSATRGLALADYISVEDVRLVHSHGPEGEHSHPTTVAYTWLSPLIAGKQADYIATELARIYPAHEDQFSANLTDLKRDLTDLAQKFDALPKPKAGQTLMVLSANPDLKFFSKAAGWEDHHLTWFEPPTLQLAAEELEKILQQHQDQPKLQQRGQTVLLSSYPFSDELLKVLQLKGVVALVIDPMDIKPTTDDYLAVMKRNLGQFPSETEDSGE